MMKVEEPWGTMIKTMSETMSEAMKQFTRKEVELIMVILDVEHFLTLLGKKDGAFEEAIKRNIKKGNLDKREMENFFRKAKRLDLMDIVDGNIVWFPSQFYKFKKPSA